MLVFAWFFFALVFAAAFSASLRRALPEWASASSLLDSDSDSTGEVSSYSSGGSAQPDGRRVVIELLSKPATRRAIRNWLLHMRVGEQDADDLVQGVVKAALESVDSFDPSRGSAERWLNGITLHFAQKHRVTQAKRLRREADVSPELLDDAQGAEDALAAEATRAGVREAVLQLNPSERMIVAGHDLDGIPMTECAQAAGVPTSTAYRWRSRGLVRLRDLLSAFAAAPDAPVPSASPGQRGGRRR